MKILLAPDKFKGSLSAYEVCQALTKGLQKSCPNAEVIAKPMADGGDGSLEVLDQYFELEIIRKVVQDPLGKPILASYKIAQSVAYVELSTASGLALLSPEERNCMYTTTFGTGELILDAIRNGARTIYLFIGGSATNDGGIGIAHALGYQFFDTQRQPLAPIGKNLLQINTIDRNHLFFELNDLAIKVICDVTNPLYGKNGAAYTYGAQKGANDEEIVFLDKGLMNLAQRLMAWGFPNVADVPGAGAAGGVGGGAIAFLGAELRAGVQTFIEITNLENEIKDCDYIITGEGKLDHQTEQGKVISGVCQLAHQYDKKIIAVCGAADILSAKKLGIHQIHTIIDRSKDLNEAMTMGSQKLEEIAAEFTF